MCFHGIVAHYYISKYRHAKKLMDRVVVDNSLEKIEF